MHWVDRGPEPDGVRQVRAGYTRGWVDYYRNGMGTKPSDFYWRSFHGDLADAFFYLCAYCEAICKGEVDHFRPKSKFSEPVYQWSNWVLTCHDCNNLKGEKWPSGGYVNPCAKTSQARPENFFDFDTHTGMITPKADLSPVRRKKAIQTIKDLHLNALHHLKKRLEWLSLIKIALSNNPNDIQEVLAFTDRRYELSSITRVFLAELGYYQRSL
jgi:uncharacterized protein (TIGR02646 family)